MKDLYKHLRLSPDATDEEIQEALADPVRGRHPSAPDARAILLRPHRRAQYDRVHVALRLLGQLRAHTDKADTPFARQHENDFRVSVVSPSRQQPAEQGRPAPGPHPHQSGPRSRAPAPAVNPVIRAFMPLWALLKSLLAIAFSYAAVFGVIALVVLAFEHFNERPKPSPQASVPSYPAQPLPPHRCV